MKKAIIAIVMLLGSATVTQAAPFIPIKIKITYERGISEWNADHTKTFCVGKGTCKITFDVGINRMTYDGTLENHDGKIYLVYPASYVNQFKEDFAGGKHSINTDITVDAATAQKLEANAFTVRAGQYNVTMDERGNAMVFLTNAR